MTGFSPVIYVSKFHTSSLDEKVIQDAGKVYEK